MTNPQEAAHRFFIEHDMIHDRLTGKHVTTEEDTVFCDGKIACCKLLNELNERKARKPLKLLFSDSWLRKKIARDPDMEIEAGREIT